MHGKVITLSDLAAKLEILTQAVLSNKAMLTHEECATYLGIGTAHLYKLTCAKAIPHYKPRGKCLYYDRVEIDEWLRQNHVASNAQLDKVAANHLAAKVA